MPAGRSAGGNLDCDLTRFWGQGPGGARRSRTDDILLAKQALYQLSYGPLTGSNTGELSAIVVKPAGRPGQTRTADLTLIRRAL